MLYILKKKQCPASLKYFHHCIFTYSKLLFASLKESMLHFCTAQVSFYITNQFSCIFCAQFSSYMKEGLHKRIIMHVTMNIRTMCYYHICIAL